jgi:hypothetical protein
MPAWIIDVKQVEMEKIDVTSAPLEYHRRRRLLLEASIGSSLGPYNLRLHAKRKLTLAVQVFVLATFWNQRRDVVARRETALSCEPGNRIQGVRETLCVLTIRCLELTPFFLEQNSYQNGRVSIDWTKFRTLSFLPKLFLLSVAHRSFPLRWLGTQSGNYLRCFRPVVLIFVAILKWVPIGRLQFRDRCISFRTSGNILTK